MAPPHSFTLDQLQQFSRILPTEFGVLHNSSLRINRKQCIGVLRVIEPNNHFNSRGLSSNQIKLAGLGEANNQVLASNCSPIFPMNTPYPAAKNIPWMVLRVEI